MAYRPNTAQGAVYPKCPDCDTNDHALFAVDFLAVDLAKDLRKLPKNATQQQFEDAIIPRLVCKDCAAERNLPLMGEIVWPPKF